MAILNFQRRFAADVASGRKRSTIRRLGKHLITPGETLHLYTGLRTKSAKRLLPPVVCTSAEGLIIGAERQLHPQQDREALAVADGFRNYTEMADYIEKTYGLPFYGQLIKW